MNNNRVSQESCSTAIERIPATAEAGGLPSLCEVIFGVDVARQGGDECVCCIRRGADVLEVIPWHDDDTMATVGRVQALARQWQPVSIFVDSIGMGAPVYDRMTELDMPAIGVNVAEKAIDGELFYNRRSELFWGLRERFEKGDISLPPADTILLDQLTQLRFSYTSRGQIRLEEKEAMRAARPLGARWRSPDRADSVMLAFSSAANLWMPGSYSSGESTPMHKKDW